MEILKYCTFVFVVYLFVGLLSFGLIFFGVNVFGLPQKSKVNRIAKWLGIGIFIICYVLFKAHIIPISVGVLSVIVIPIWIRFLLFKIIKTNTPEQAVIIEKKDFSVEEELENLESTKKKSNHLDYMP